MILCALAKSSLVDSIYWEHTCDKSNCEIWGANQNNFPLVAARLLLNSGMDALHREASIPPESYSYITRWCRSYELEIPSDLNDCGIAEWNEYKPRCTSVCRNCQTTHYMAWSICCNCNEPARRRTDRYYEDVDFGAYNRAYEPVLDSGSFGTIHSADECSFCAAISRSIRYGSRSNQYYSEPSW